MTTEITKCPIWGEEYEAVGYVRQDPSEAVVRESARAGGGYIIPGSVRLFLPNLDHEEKARLTTWLVDQRLQGNNCPTVTEEIVQYVINRRQLPIYDRADRLLRFLCEQTKVAGHFVDLSASAPQPNPTILYAMAWSESTSRDEIYYLAEYLREEGWIQQYIWPTTMGDIPQSKYRVEVRGHLRIADQMASINPSQAFVAMWFDDSVRDAYDEGIERAIRDCGYEPKRIDRDSTVDKIDDAIIAEIRRSRFIVADFTHGNGGARGGVYYEAGFAHGLGIPVIFTCRRDMIDEVHFDTRQYAHILWDNPSDLRGSLRDRILARVGKGPELMA